VLDYGDAIQACVQNIPNGQMSTVEWKNTQITRNFVAFATNEAVRKELDVPEEKNMDWDGMKVGGVKNLMERRDYWL